MFIYQTHIPEKKKKNQNVHTHTSMFPVKKVVFKSENCACLKARLFFPLLSVSVTRGTTSLQVLSVLHPLTTAATIMLSLLLEMML